MTNKTLICPECGATFRQENGRQRFCSTEHKQRFHRLMEKRGRLLTPIAISWQANCRSTDEKRAALAKYARNQKDGLLRKWAAEDRAAARNCDLVTAERQEALWQYVDAET
jgi:hypothetical protein